MASAILSGCHIPHTCPEHAAGHSFSEGEARLTFNLKVTDWALVKTEGSPGPTM